MKKNLDPKLSRQPSLFSIAGRYHTNVSPSRAIAKLRFARVAKLRVTPR